MKYIMTSRGPIIFPNNFNHSDFKNIGPDIDLKSAGIVVCDIGEDCKVHAVTVGSSITLGLYAKEEDSEDLELFITNLINGV